MWSVQVQVPSFHSFYFYYYAFFFRIYTINLYFATNQEIESFLKTEKKDFLFHLNCDKMEKYEYS